MKSSASLWLPPSTDFELERLCQAYPSLGQLLVRHIFFAGMRCAYAHKAGPPPNALLEALRFLEASDGRPHENGNHPQLGH